MTLAVVPLIAITGLSVFGVAVTAGAALNLLDATYYEKNVTTDGELLMGELQKERRLSLNSKTGLAALRTQRDGTDLAYTNFRDHLTANKVREQLTLTQRRLVEAYLGGVESLRLTRSDVDTGRADAVTVVNRYSEVIDVAYQMFAPLTELSDPNLARLARGTFSISRAREMLSREDAVVTGAVLDGRITPAELGLVQRAIGARRAIHDDASASLLSPHRESFQAIFAGSSYTSLFAMEEKLSSFRTPGTKPPIDAKIWRDATDSVLTQMSTTEAVAAGQTAKQANDVGITAFTRPILAGLLGLICAAIALALALHTGRSVVRRLERLRVAALEVAHERLPRAIAALRQPGALANDPALAEVPLVAVGSDEVGQVGHAFGAVQRTAIRAALDEATLRRGISDVFLNIARRSQALLHRQLTLLDRMERRTTEPQELEDLFRLDHMATRMRRHAEALVILAGSAPGRGWRHPVPVVDVVRGATSEIEDYVRVSLDRLPDVKILGRAVGDLIHLLAELLENATSFAPPHTRVRVFVEMVGHGLALHVEDRGLGMSEAELIEANARLAEPPPFDPTHSARLGLLVVAKLAARQGITVQLRTSSYGGITAVVLVPSELVLTDTTPVEPVTRVERRRAARAVEAAEAVTAPVVVATVEVVPDEPTIDLTAGSTAGSTDGLPKRTRRAAAEATSESSSAREATIAVALPTEQPATQPRSADQVRAMMSAFQSGTARGRAAAPMHNDGNMEQSTATADRTSVEDSTTLEGRA